MEGQWSPVASIRPTAERAMSPWNRYGAQHMESGHDADMMEDASIFPRIACPIDKLPLTRSSGSLVCSNDHRRRASPPRHSHRGGGSSAAAPCHTDQVVSPTHTGIRLGTVRITGDGRFEQLLPRAYPLACPGLLHAQAGDAASHLPHTGEAGTYRIVNPVHLPHE